MTNYIVIYVIVLHALLLCISNRKCVLKNNVKLDLLWTVYVIDVNQHFASIICSVYLKSDTYMTRYYTVLNSWCHISQVTCNLTEIFKPFRVLFSHVKYTVKYVRNKELVILNIVHNNAWNTVFPYHTG